MTRTIVLGDGPLGQALGEALRAHGDVVEIRGRPQGERHEPAAFRGVDVVIDASRGAAVAANVEAALAGGCRAFVIATTGWNEDADPVGATLRRAGAVAVAAPNLAVGASVFLRLVEEAARLVSAVGGFEPAVVEWHRRSKADRPSGTAREIVRRVARHLPIELDEVGVIRSGSMPGMHVVGLDGTSETIEIRLTARNRSGYAAGALAAIDWLREPPRSSGLHSFDEVIDERIAAGAPAAGTPAARTPAAGTPAAGVVPVA